MNTQLVDTQSTKVSNIGKLLIDLGKVTPEDTERILRKQKEDGTKFGDAAKQLGLITEDDLQYVLSQQFEYSYLSAENSSYSRDLVAAYAPFSSQAENFRGIRSQLLFRWFNEGLKAISVVGANSGDGTSFTAANLAVVFSQLSKKTLLIDGNMRDPRQHKMFNLKQSFGLSDILADRTPGSEALFNIPDLPHLTVLGAGTIPPNPQELIGRSNFPQLIKYASSIFDVIIVDTPAISQGSDAQMLSCITRGSVIVTRLNHSLLSETVRLRKEIEASGASVVGAVVNSF